MRRKRYKDRMMTSFINATEELIDEMGVENLTLRKIATRAGYNSATVYNYFENLDHLIFYASMSNIKDYNIALNSYLKDAKNAMDIFLKCGNAFATSHMKNQKFIMLYFFQSSIII